jgi:hypothetical protein
MASLKGVQRPTVVLVMGSVGAKMESTKIVLDPSQSPLTQQINVRKAYDQMRDSALKQLGLERE